MLLAMLCLLGGKSARCSESQDDRCVRLELEGFSISVPADWKESRVDPHSGRALPVAASSLEQLKSLSSILMVGPEGRFFYAEHGPGRQDGASSAVWLLVGHGDGIEIAKEGNVCKLSDDPPGTPYPCPEGRGQLFIDGWATVKGQRYYFSFGSYKQDVLVDYEVFREILRSFRVTR
jgi:hypothetical protein